MKFILLTFLSISSFQAPIIPTHNYYLGLIEIDNKNTSTPTEITIRVFNDDLENCLRNAFDSYKKGIDDTFCENHFNSIETYFSNHFSIKINGKKQDLIFKSCKRENDIYWLKFELNYAKKWESVEVFADFFMELFPDQSNVVSVYYGKKMGHCRLVKNHDKETIIFN